MMTDQPYTPTLDDALDEIATTLARFRSNKKSIRAELDQLIAQVRAEEREHVNQQIQNRLDDFEPEDKEDGYLITPATITIRVSDLNDIISGGDSDVRFSFTDEEWEKHISEVEAAAEQRGAIKALREAADEVLKYDPRVSLRGIYAAMRSRADQMEGDDE